MKQAEGATSVPSQGTILTHECEGLELISDFQFQNLLRHWRLDHGSTRGIL